MQGEKRSFSGAKARIFNAADRQKSGLDRARGLFRDSLVSSHSVNELPVLDFKAQRSNNAGISRCGIGFGIRSRMCNLHLEPDLNLHVMLRKLLPQHLWQTE
jgi:hypothetical protein